jgi:hypothetical protein
MSLTDPCQLLYEVLWSEFEYNGDGRLRTCDFQTNTKGRKSKKINGHITLLQVFFYFKICTVNFYIFSL